METLCTSVWAWCSWIIIGVIAGLMCGFVLPGRRIVPFDVTIGLLGAIIGGWGSALMIGDSTPQTFAIAALVALFVSGAIDDRTAMRSRKSRFMLLSDYCD